MTLQAGERAGPYELIARLGAGGMGEVWLATESRLNRKVAVKFLPADLTNDPDRANRFEHEARAASALSHPNVCHVYALGETATGQRFIAMELVEGQTLRTHLRDSPIPVARALDIGIQIAKALSAAHAIGIVHRDVKPENVMLRRDGLVKVLDFGLAKLAPSPGGPDADQTHTVRTRAGTMVGTVAYMSPEQARGQQVDGRTDIWAIAVVLYEMVSGRNPFARSNSSDTLAAILTEDPASPVQLGPQVPSELQRIIGKALRKDPERRYQVMKDLELDLEALREEMSHNERSGTDAASPPVARTPMHVPRLSRRSLALGALIALVGVLIGVLVWLRAGAPVKSPGRPATASPRTLTRLTVGPGLQTDPTFSPDGRFVAYASDSGGNFDIWVVPIAGGDPVQITNSPAAEMQPDWSPDGSAIVFRSERDGGGLYVVPALGGAEQRLTSMGMYPKWSRDGSEIFFIVLNTGGGTGLQCSRRGRRTATDSRRFSRSWRLVLGRVSPGWAGVGSRRS